ncbi:MAG: acyltransferase [Proteobacteria bacterium]|nr:acyltransferase [Pseudomonadota bacterium]
MAKKTATNKTGKFTIGIVQMAMVEDKAKNLKKALSFIDQAAKKGVQVLCLPELFGSLYFCQSEDHKFFKLAEPIDGPTTKALQVKAKQHKMVIINSIFEKRAAGLYHNTAVIIDADGSINGVYRKMHIPDDPLYYEKFYFTPGDLGFNVWKTRYGKIGVLVCWDQWYPEGARLTAMKGADVLFYPTAIGWHPREKAEYGAVQADAWETIQRSHAIANGVYVAAANRIGYEKSHIGDKHGGIEFFGNSFISNPSGKILTKAGSKKEEILTAIVDPELTDITRTHWPFLRDRRIDAYGAITKRIDD